VVQTLLAARRKKRIKGHACAQYMETARKAAPGFDGVNLNEL
jgi:hypothetical protein